MVWYVWRKKSLKRKMGWCFLDAQLDVCNFRLNKLEDIIYMHMLDELVDRLWQHNHIAKEGAYNIFLRLREIPCVSRVPPSTISGLFWLYGVIFCSEYAYRFVNLSQCFVKLTLHPIFFITTLAFTHLNN